MKSKPMAAFGVFALLCALAVAAILWLGNAHVMPQTQTVNQVLPDDRIPH